MTDSVENKKILPELRSFCIPTFMLIIWNENRTYFVDLIDILVFFFLFCFVMDHLYPENERPVGWQVQNVTIPNLSSLICT